MQGLLAATVAIERTEKQCSSIVCTMYRCMRIMNFVIIFMNSMCFKECVELSFEFVREMTTIPSKSRNNSMQCLHWYSTLIYVTCTFLMLPCNTIASHCLVEINKNYQSFKQPLSLHTLSLSPSNSPSLPRFFSFLFSEWHSHTKHKP